MQFQAAGEDGTYKCGDKTCKPSLLIVWDSLPISSSALAFEELELFTLMVSFLGDRKDTLVVELRPNFVIEPSPQWFVRVHYQGLTSLGVIESAKEGPLKREIKLNAHAIRVGALKSLDIVWGDAGVTSHGNWGGGTPSGRWEIASPNGSLFTCDLQQGVSHGLGALRNGDHTYVGFWVKDKFRYGGLKRGSEIVIWDAVFGESHFVKGKTKSPLGPGLYEGDLGDRELPHGRGVIKDSNGKVIMEGMWNHGVLEAKQGPLGLYFGKFDRNGSPSGKIKVVDSNNTVVYWGKVTESMKPNGRSCHYGIDGNRPRFADGDPLFPCFRVEDARAVANSRSKDFGVLVSPGNTVFIGGLSARDHKKHGVGVEYDRQALFIGSWQDGKRHGFGQLQWPQGVSTFRDYSSGHLVSEQPNLSAQMAWSSKILKSIAIRIVPIVFQDSVLQEVLETCLPSASEESSALAAYDILRKALETKTSKLNISEIFLAGSLGKGTRIRDETELEIVVILNEFDQKNYGDYCKLAEECLSPHGSDFRRTPSSLLFFAKDEIEAEIRFGPALTREQLIILPPAGPDDFSFHSRLALQVDFVKKQHPLCLDLIRLVKFWRSELPWPAGRDLFPKQYLLELICIDVFRTTNDHQLRNLFWTTMNRIEQLDSLQVVFLVNYGDWAIPQNLRGQLPLVLDVASPSNNIVNTLEYGLLKLYGMLTMRALK